MGVAKPEPSIKTLFWFCRHCWTTPELLFHQVSRHSRDGLLLQGKQGRGKQTLIPEYRVHPPEFEEHVYLKCIVVACFFNPKLFIEGWVPFILSSSLACFSSTDWEKQLWRRFPSQYLLFPPNPLPPPLHHKTHTSQNWRRMGGRKFVLHGHLQYWDPSVGHAYCDPGSLEPSQFHTSIENADFNLMMVIF